MKKFYSRKQFSVHPINKELFRQLEAYINTRLPELLQLNVEKGRPDPLSDFILLTAKKELFSQYYRSIADYESGVFETDIRELSLELSHYSKFNYYGQKIIVIMLQFDIAKNTCDLSIALFDEDARRKVMEIEKGIRNILLQSQKVYNRIQTLQPTVIE